MLNQAVIIGTYGTLSLLSNNILQKIGFKATVQLSNALMLLGALGLLAANTILPQSYLMMTVFMSLFCAGFAICYPVVFSMSLDVFPQLRGTASSFIMGARALMVTALSGVVSVLYNGSAISLSVWIAGASGVAILLLMSILNRQTKLATA